jgi:D-amino-acid dehydrogenase
MAEPTGRKRVIIIGAGIVGVCCAIELRKKGFAVTVVDRVPPGESCSFGNAGVLAAWSCVPQSMPGVLGLVPGWLLDPEGPLSIRWTYMPRLLPWLVRFLRAGRAERVPAIADAMRRLHEPTVESYKALAKEAGAEDLVRESTYIHVYRDARRADLELPEWRLRCERGARLTVLRDGELHEAEPALGPGYRAGIMVGPQGHTTSPGRLVQVLADYVRRLGGTVVQAEVHRLRSGSPGPVRLDTDAGEMTAERVVVAAGAWSHQLAAQIGLKVPLESQRGYHLTFARSGIELRHPIMETERKVVATSMEPGLRLAGTAEFAGLDARPRWRRARMLVSLGKRLFPDLDTAAPSEWMGHRPSLPDSLPVIGPAPTVGNVYFAFGHGHTGLTGAPMTARIIAGMVTDAPLNFDVSPYRADRF